GRCSSLPAGAPCPDGVCSADGLCAHIPRLGAPCTTAAECAIDQFCVDGVCCNEPCGGGVADCQACNLGGDADGTCSVVMNSTPCPGGACADGVCESAAQDRDGDGTPDDKDNCPDTYNPSQNDDPDGDKLGDACDPDDDD